MQQTLAVTMEGQDYSVVLLDLDLFKQVNDSYGHKAGDQVLHEVAEILATSLPSKAIVSRYGGEEFLIVLPNTMHNETMTISEQIRARISQHIIKTDEGCSFRMTASLGLYTLTSDELDRIKEKHFSKEKLNSIAKFKPKLMLPRFKSPEFNQHKTNLLTESLSASQQQLPNDICQYLISVADKALYKAKNMGRNQVVSANEMLAAGILDNIN